MSDSILTVTAYIDWENEVKFDAKKIDKSSNTCTI